MSRQETLQTAIWEYYDLCWNQGDFSVVERFAGDFEVCSNNLWAIEGPDGIKASMKRLRDSISDMRGCIDEWFFQIDVDDTIFGRCDRVNIWWTIKGRFDRKIMGICPTGKWVTIRGSSLLWLRENRLVGARACSDIYQQLGSLPQAV